MAVSAHRDKQLHAACYCLATVLKHCKQAVEYQRRRGETGCYCPPLNPDLTPGTGHVTVPWALPLPGHGGCRGLPLGSP